MEGLPLFGGLPRVKLPRGEELRGERLRGEVRRGESLREPPPLLGSPLRTSRRLWKDSFLGSPLLKEPGVGEPPLNGGLREVGLPTPPVTPPPPLLPPLGLSALATLLVLGGER